MADKESSKDILPFADCLSRIDIKVKDREEVRHRIREGNRDQVQVRRLTFVVNCVCSEEKK